MFVLQWTELYIGIGIGIVDSNETHCQNIHISDRCVESIAIPHDNHSSEEGFVHIGIIVEII